MKKFIITVLTIVCASDAFLFPDLSQRSVRGSGYNVAVMEGEPYLYPNGSGYVPDLLEQISRSSGFEQGDRPLPLSVVPVRTWKQLVEKAKAQIGFGMLLHSIRSQYLRTTIPTLRTSPKLLVKTVAMSLDANQRSTVGNPVILMKSEPLLTLFTVRLSYPGDIHTVDHSKEGVELLKRSPVNTVMLSNAATMDYAASQSNGLLTSVCPKPSISDSDGMYYAFFGSDTELLAKINRGLISMISDGRLAALNSRYFSNVKHC